MDFLLLLVFERTVSLSSRGSVCCKHGGDVSTGVGSCELGLIPFIKKQQVCANAVNPATPKLNLEPHPEPKHSPAHFFIFKDRWWDERCEPKTNVRLTQPLYRLQRKRGGLNFLASLQSIFKCVLQSLTFFNSDSHCAWQLLVFWFLNSAFFGWRYSGKSWWCSLWSSKCLLTNSAGART